VAVMVTRSLLGYPLYYLFHFAGMKTERAGLTLVGDPSVAIDDVQAIRPTGICRFGRVVESVEEGRHLKMQPSDARACHCAALPIAFRAGEDHILLNVRGHLPDVAGMRLLNVNDVERNAILVLFI